MKAVNVKNIDPSSKLAFGKSYNPFPGLRPFKIEESHLFFGREGQSDEVLLKLSKHRFVGIIGPSGSGKSSFIYCGVLPILYGGFLTGKSTEWEVVVTRPGASPIQNLAESLIETDLAGKDLSQEDIKIKKTIINSLLKSSSMGLVETILKFRKNSDKNYLILVDQFEELFRFKDSSSANSLNDTLAFINLLMEAINYKGAPIYVAITMRSDFIGECSQFPELTKKINDSQYLIPQMTREQKRRAITGPVAVGEAEISSRLIQQLLNDLGDNPDQLPILQHALMRTWDYWSHFKDYESEALDIKHYEAIGTMSEALSMHANEAYDELDEEQKRICEFLFKAITEKRGGNYGIRRPTKLTEIAAIADTNENELIKVIDKFRDPSRSLLTPQHGVPLNNESIIDISHESIMRIWNRLKNWVNDEEDAKQMYKRLAEAAEMYQEGKTGLWRPPDLQLAVNWKEKHQPTLDWGKRYHPAFERTMAFLTHSEEEYTIEQRSKELQQKRRLRTARITALIMGGATVVCILFLVYAFIQQTVAEKARKLAEEKTEEATFAKKNADEEKEKALIQKTRAEEQTILAETNRRKAESASEEAEQQKETAILAKKAAEASEIKANEEAINARLAEKEADEQRIIAVAKEKEATKLRYLETAKAISAKSTQINAPQLKGLLAQQAYLFNEKYGNYNYSPEIYDGLYGALKSFEDPLTRSIPAHDKSAKVVISGRNEYEFFSGGSLGSIIRWNKRNNYWEADTIVGKRERRLVKSLILDEGNNRLLAAGQFINSAGQSVIESYDLTKPSKEPELIAGLSGSFVKMKKDEDNFYVLDEGGKSLKSLKNGIITELYRSEEKINDFDPDYNKKGFWLGLENGNLNFISSDGSNLRTMFQNSAPISSVKSFFYTAIGDINGGIKLFTDKDFDNSTELTGHQGGIDDFAISSDGLFLVSSSKDKTARVWNMSEVTVLPIVLSDHSNWVWSVDLSKNDREVYTADEDGFIKVWPLSIDKMGEKMCDYLQRNMTKTEWATYIGADLEIEKTCQNLDK